MDEQYIKPVPGGRWAISRLIGGEWVCLVQDTPLYDPEDASTVLGALGIATTTDNLEQHFPMRGDGCRCPTFELIELCSTLDPTHPLATMDGRGKSSV